MDFTAIDFETANEQPDSACQLGAVVVRGGELVERHCWMIRPQPFRFSGHNIAIHGITPDQVHCEPEFGDLWKSIWDALAGQVLVAHNARFDLGVLKACLQRYRISMPDVEFSCTRVVSRAAWPGEQGYGLRAIADRLGITFQHHDALEDAACCAKVLLAAADTHRAHSLESLERRLKVTRGRAGEWGCGGPRGLDSRYEGPRLGRRNQSSRIYQQRLRLRGTADDLRAETIASPQRLQAWQENARLISPLSAQVVAMTGLFTTIDRDEAEQLVVAAGGVNGKSVTKQTTMLVVGTPDARTLRAGRNRSSKESRAEQLRSDGQAIRILDEAELLQLFNVSQVST